MSSSQAKPNVILYISHDTGRFIGPYGYATVQTPFLDAFAAEATVYENAFATCPLCCPSRASITTSLYPHEAGVNGLTTGITGNFDMTTPDRHLASRLGKAGYETVVCGPIHEAQNIWDLGFAKNLGGSGTGQNYGGDTRTFAGEISDWLAAREDDVPFYLQIGSHETHRDWRLPDVPPDDSKGVWIPPGVIQNEESRDEMAAMQGAVRRMDDCLAAILAAVEAAGKKEDTLVILTTDHGIDMPDNKGTLTDRGLGVFLMVRFPGGEAAGARVSAMVSGLDVAPTVFDCCGLPQPEYARGHSLRGPATESLTETPAVFAEKTYHDGYDPTRTIRTSRYRYIRYFDVSVLRDIRLDSYRHSYLFASELHRKTHEELFDLKNDPSEMSDLSGNEQYAETIAALRTRLAEWMRETNDPLLDGPVVSPLFEETRAEFRRLAGLAPADAAE